jgi:hypothetical protein
MPGGACIRRPTNQVQAKSVQEKAERVTEARAAAEAAAEASKNIADLMELAASKGLKVPVGAGGGAANSRNGSGGEGGGGRKGGPIVGSGRLEVLGATKRVQADVGLGADAAAADTATAAAVVPVLVVNWTAVFARHAHTLDYSPTAGGYTPAARALVKQTEALATAAAEAGGGPAAVMARIAYDAVLAEQHAVVVDALERDPEATVEQMFAACDAFHATSDTVAAVAEQVTATFPPGACIGYMEYPAVMWTGETPASAWSTVARNAIWPCVTRLKKHVANCCRPL